MSPISIPTTSALAHSQRVPSANPAVFRILNKLSRSSLLSLILDWLEDGYQPLTAPYLRGDEQEDDDEQDLYPAVSTLEELREYYNVLQAQRGAKREVVDRVIEGDWRSGLSLYQLATADMQYLYDHPLSQKWTALKVVRMKGDDGDDEPSEPNELPSIPRFHPPTFLQNLQREALPDVKAHYILDRPKSLPMLLLLRIYVLESPYNTSLALSSSKPEHLDASKTIYVAFPDSSPHIFVSLTTSLPGSTTADKSNPWDARSLRKLILDGIPKAFSRPRARYTLQSTNLSAKSLEALNARRGKGRSGAAGGGWGSYATEKTKTDTPLNNQLPTPPAEDESEDELAADPETVVSRSMKRKSTDDSREALKRRKLIARGRFGDSGIPDDGQGIERLDIRIEDPFPTISEALLAHAESRERPDAPAAARRRKGRRSAVDIELELENERRKAMDEDHDDESQGWRPDIRITFHGSHIFAGIRELVEHGVIDGEKMPGWMTGEEGVSVGVVKDGRICGFKGSGLSG